jgi:hypothetical protein
MRLARLRDEAPPRPARGHPSTSQRSRISPTRGVRRASRTDGGRPHALRAAGARCGTGAPSSHKSANRPAVAVHSMLAPRGRVPCDRHVFEVGLYAVRRIRKSTAVRIEPAPQRSRFDPATHKNSHGGRRATRANPASSLYVACRAGTRRAYTGQPQNRRCLWTCSTRRCIADEKHEIVVARRDFAGRRHPCS